MIENFTDDLILNPVKLLRKDGDDLYDTWVVKKEFEGYVFNTRTTTRDESGYAYTTSFNLYVDPIINVNASDRILWNNELYAITSIRKSISKDINYTTLTLSYIKDDE